MGQLLAEKVIKARVITIEICQNILTASIKFLWTADLGIFANSYDGESALCNARFRIPFESEPQKGKTDLLLYCEVCESESKQIIRKQKYYVVVEFKSTE